VQTPVTGARTSGRHVVSAIALAVILQALVFGLVFPHLWYRVHYLSDTNVDLGYAWSLAHGGVPYRDFHPEYPPLALWLVTPPVLGMSSLGPAPDEHSASFATYREHRLNLYQRHFAIEMFGLTLASAVVVVLVATTLWPSTRRGYLAAVGFALFTVALGAIVENRFDIAVGLILATTLLALARRRLVIAGFLLGLGFALKLTPVMILPLVLLVAGWRRRTLAVLGAFLVAAIGPFLPYLLGVRSDVAALFLYHLRRPLEIESVLGLPTIVDHLVFHATIGKGYDYHSFFLTGSGTHLAAALSEPLTLAAVALTIVVIARRREVLRAVPQKLPLALLAITLASLAFSKVLSPQYMLWLLPVVALVALDDVVLGLLMLASVALTQVEFPTLFNDILAFRAAALSWLCLRNLLLLSAFAVSLWRLVRLPVVPSSDLAIAPPRIADLEPPVMLDCCLAGRQSRDALGQPRAPYLNELTAVVHGLLDAKESAPPAVRHRSQRAMALPGVLGLALVVAVAALAAWGIVLAATSRGDGTPPTTRVHGAAGWHNHAVKLTFTAVDNRGGFGVAATYYKVDQAKTWTEGTRVTIAAPADHSNDGLHTVRYYSLDKAHNVEHLKSVTVKIDTRQPSTEASPESVVQGATATLRCFVRDARPCAGWAHVRVWVRNAHGDLVCRLAYAHQRTGVWFFPAFRCTLVRGTYRYSVYATDAAGNTQSTMGTSTLVVR
jgi:hypothetical protein